MRKVTTAYASKERSHRTIIMHDIDLFVTAAGKLAGLNFGLDGAVNQAIGRFIAFSKS